MVAVLGILQRDLGTTLILCTTVFLMLFVAGVRLRYLSVAGDRGLLGVAYLILGESYRRARFVEAYLRPWDDPKETGIS